MKILHLIYTEGISGAEKHISHLLPGLKEYGFDCELMIICSLRSAEKLNSFGEEIAAAGVRVTVFPASHSLTLKTIKTIKEYLCKNDISVVHSHLIRTDLLISIVKHLFLKDLFIISTKHGYNEKVLIKYSPENFEVKKDLYYHITKYTLKHINANISISECISRLFINLQLSRKFYHVIYHGVNIPFICRKAPGEDTLLSEKNVLVIVGRLEKYKGHSYMLEAMPAILEKFPETELIFVGSGSYKKNLEEEVDRLKIDRNVKFAGFQKNPYDFISNARVVVVPSIFEPFGLVFPEAMALGKNIVAFDVPAGNEILINDQTAVLVPARNSKLLAEKIIYLLNNNSEAARISENAFEEYERNFTVPIMVKKTAEYYREILGMD